MQSPASPRRCGPREWDRGHRVAGYLPNMPEAVSAMLAAGSTLPLYDGSPFHPDGNILFDFADAEAMTHFGTSAKFIDGVNKAGWEPIRTHGLKTVTTMLSTGSPLVPESFDFVYCGIKRNLCLSSISGGTDIMAIMWPVPSTAAW